MKMFSFVGLFILSAVAIAPLSSAQAGGTCCCGNTVVTAAASPAAATTAAPATAVAQNQYRSFSYQPAAATSVRTYNSSSRRSGQPMWMNGANKSMGRYN